MAQTEKSDGSNDDLAPYPSAVGDVEEYAEHTEHIKDPVFGEIDGEGPNYRNVGWIGTCALMMKIGLGVLSIPTAFDVLGVVPGVVCLCAFAAITTWSDYIIGVFKMNHREVYSIDDAGGLMFGRVGRIVLGTAFCLYWIFVSGSAMLGISIGLNAVSEHGLCTAGFVAIAMVATFALSSIRTLGRITSLAWIGLACIMTAILCVSIAVGVQDRPVDAPQTGVWVSDYKIVAKPSFVDAASALSALAFAYSGTPAFFPIVSEMRDPRHYTKSLLIAQTFVTMTYLTIGVVVYYYCGSYVASPALGSASHTMKKVAYGFALPGLMVTATLVNHIPAKYIFVRLLRGTKHLSSSTAIHWFTWFGCTFGIALIAYIIASAIPVFNGLVSLIGALLGTLMSIQPMGCMWLYDNWSVGKEERTARWTAMVCWSVFVVAAGMFTMIAGTYGSVAGIIETYREAGGSAAWSCADNSNSV